MKKRIIITEDDFGIQDILQLFLNKAGYETILITDGRLLYEQKFELPDLFLLDKQLSGSNGLDICKYLKKNKSTKNIPIIIISATPDVKLLAKEAGADDFIEKPFSMKILLDTIDKLINV